MAEIQVLIAAYGPDALKRIAALGHAPFPGVEYLVGWQNHQGADIPRELGERGDFRIFRLESVGLSNNRNALMSHATADVAAIADDDLIYETRHFETIKNGVKRYPDCHLLTFRYESEGFPKTYPGETFDLRQPAKNYFLTSMEIVLNLSLIRRDFGNLEPVYFHPGFGVNGEFFGSGEEDLMVERLLRRGCRGRFIPADICINTDSTTSERIGQTEGFIRTKGAVIGYLKPATWLPRMLTHALRASRSPKGGSRGGDGGAGRIPFARYCSWWLGGYLTARRLRLFKGY